VAAAGLMLPAAAAQAHDVLESTTPADGATVGTVPRQVELDFSSTPIALGSEVIVKDSTGTNQADGPVSIVDNHVSQALKAGAPTGPYTVQWRIVSSDSHPIEGSFTFTAGTGGTTGPAAAPAEPAATDTATTTAAAGGESAASTGLPAVLITGGAIALVLVILLVAVTRRRLNRGDSGG
jgi:methionine-rich copper-binding protein CopC